MSRPRILSIDIETTPNLAHVWGIWQQNVGINQLLQSTEMLCFAAKWYGEPRKTIQFYSAHEHGRLRMVREAHRLLSEADVLMHYNGRSFDVKHLNREFAEFGMNPPSPFQQIDLLHVVKQRFRFPSNKLAYVSKALGLRGKLDTGGHELWIRCLAGDEKAWVTMEKYNKQDVFLMDELYDRIRPWIPNPPNAQLFGGRGDCPDCNSKKLTKQGTYKTAVSTFQRYQCLDCGRWIRSGKRVEGTDLRAAAL